MLILVSGRDLVAAGVVVLISSHILVAAGVVVFVSGHNFVAARVIILVLSNHVLVAAGVVILLLFGSQSCYLVLLSWQSPHALFSNDSSPSRRGNPEKVLFRNWIMSKGSVSPDSGIRQYVDENGVRTSMD